MFFVNNEKAIETSTAYIHDPNKTFMKLLDPLNIASESLDNSLKFHTSTELPEMNARDTIIRKS